jgi:hypothetical protein
MPTLIIERGRVVLTLDRVICASARVSKSLAINIDANNNMSGSPIYSRLFIRPGGDGLQRSRPVATHGTSDGART